MAETAVPIEHRLSSAAWVGNRLTIEDRDVVEHIRRSKLSASTMSAVLGCPARMASNYTVTEADDPFGDRELGKSGHSVIEDLMNLPPHERTLENAKRILNEHAAKEWSLSKLERRTKAAVKANAEARDKWIAIITESVEGLFEIELPASIDVVHTEMKLDGIRIAHGPGAESGVPLIGYVDRTRRLPDGTIAIDDWKLSKTFKRPNPRHGDNYGDQQRTYKAGVELLTDETVSQAKLLYPRARNERVIDISEKEMNGTLARFRKAWGVMNDSADEGAFLATPSNLCGWCLFANSCPVANVTTENAKKNAARQPSAAQLGIPVLRPGAHPVTAAESDAREIDGPRMCASDEDIFAPDPENNGETTMTDEIDLQVRPEGPAYEESVNGALNLNSFAAIAVSGFVSDAAKTLNAAGERITPASLEKLAEIFASIVLRAQYGLTGQANFQRGAQTRLRGFLYAATEINPVPFGADEDGWLEWIGKTERFLRVAMTAAMNLYDRVPMDTDAHLHFAAPAE